MRRLENSLVSSAHQCSQQGRDTSLSGSPHVDTRERHLANETVSNHQKKSWRNLTSYGGSAKFVRHAVVQSQGCVGGHGRSRAGIGTAGVGVYPRPLGRRDSSTICPLIAQPVPVGSGAAVRSSPAVHQSSAGFHCTAAPVERPVEAQHPARTICVRAAGSRSLRDRQGGLLRGVTRPRLRSKGQCGLGMRRRRRR